jgi:hypothetical protein
MLKPMLRRPWEKLTRGGAAVVSVLAALSLAALAQCSVFDLGALDRGSGAQDAHESGTGLADAAGGALPDGPASAADASDGSPSLGNVGPPDVRVGGDAPGDSLGEDVGHVSEGGPPRDARTTDVVEGGLVDAPVALGDADAGCVTSVPVVGGQLLFGFPTNDVRGWTPLPASGAITANLGWTSAQGNACPGALSLTVGFGAYDGTSASVSFDFGTAQQGAVWSATKRLHAWVKLAMQGDAGTFDYAALNGIELSLSSNGGANFSFLAQDVNPTFNDGAWHEMVLQFSASASGQPGRSGPDVATANVQRMSVLVSVASLRPAGASSPPATVVLLLDDVWIE